ncbi:MAG: hypothetical protein U0931_04965 [Vulcanimicrobiota bacterium]
MAFPDLEDLLKKALLNQPHGLKCTLGPDGIHQPVTYFWGGTPVEVVCFPDGQLGFAGEAFCGALGESPDVLDTLSPEDVKTITINRPLG